MRYSEGDTQNENLQCFFCMSMMLRPCNWMLAVGVVCVSTVATFALARAGMRLAPTGYDVEGESSDDNGSLDESHGAAAPTWADVSGILRAVDTDLTNAASGGYSLVAGEANTSLSDVVGAYDIDVAVDGLGNVTVANGGTCKRRSDLTADRSVDINIEFDQFQFGGLAQTIAFTYRSTTTAALSLPFAATGDEKVEAQVSQNGGQWSGVAVAWDLQPGHPILDGVLALE